MKDRTMLVLARKTGESIDVGNDVRITIIRTAGDVVRVGIEAPKELRILRTELSEPVPHAEVYHA